MSITDELREFMDGADGYELWCPRHKNELRAIADRIDERHAVKVERLEKYRAAVDAMLKEYVKLPVDANGIPIRVGDELVDEKGRPVTVRVLKLRENGWLFDSSREGGGMLTTPFHHAQPDSWERIIDDAAKLARGDNDAVMELVSRCRRLASCITAKDE